jgi:hypothetical protein
MKKRLIKIFAPLRLGERIFFILLIALCLPLVLRADEGIYTQNVGGGGGGGTPAGSNGQLQYNNGGAFGGLSSGTSGQALLSQGAGQPPAWGAAGGGTPGGSNLQLQYNNNGILGGLSLGTAGQFLQSGGSGSLASFAWPTWGQYFTASGPTAARTKTLEDANDTILELGGSYAPTGNWSPTGTWNFGGATVLGIAPPGSDTQVIFNQGGAFGANSNLTYNYTNDYLTLGNVKFTGTGQTYLYTGGSWVLKEDLTVPPGNVVVDSPLSVVSGSGTGALCNSGLEIGFPSQTANTFLAAPNGSNGLPVFRALVPADVPITNSLTTSGGSIQLVNDSASPGNSYYYGTNTSGTKGWFSLPSSMVYPGAGVAVSSGTSGPWSTSLSFNVSTSTITCNITGAAGSAALWGSYLTASGPTAARTKTLRDANDTILELGGGTVGNPYVPTGYWNWGSATLSSIPAGALTGTLGLSNGGTGQTTQQAALTALAGSQTSGYYLRSNGTNTLLAAIQAGDVPITNSLTTSGGSIQFVNDSASPGNSYYYGTNASGTKGWFSLPSSMVYPGAGVAVSSGTSGPWSTSLSYNAITNTITCNITGTAAGDVQLSPSSQQTGNINVSGTITSGSGFSGNLTGNVTGTASGNLVPGGALGTPSSGNLGSCTLTNYFWCGGSADSHLTNAYFMGGLGTGLVKNTTSTGVPSIAVAGNGGDFQAGPVLASTTSASSLTPAVGSTGQTIIYQYTALAANLTINVPTGTPQTGQVLRFIIKPTPGSTTYTLTFSTSTGGFQAGTTIPLPTTTVANQKLICAYQYDANSNTWDLVGDVGGFAN